MLNNTNVRKRFTRGNASISLPQSVFTRFSDVLSDSTVSRFRSNENHKSSDESRESFKQHKKQKNKNKTKFVGWSSWLNKTKLGEIMLVKHIGSET